VIYGVLVAYLLNFARLVLVFIFLMVILSLIWICNI
jgi:hypothetical protein